MKISANGQFTSAVGGRVGVFFDRTAVTDALDKASKRVLSKFGAFVRRDARQSIREPRQLRLSEMSKERRRSYYIAQNEAKAEGKRRPKRPPAPSDPHTPPRSRTGLLKRGIYFGYDPHRQSVVIGPAAAGPKTADALEYGGTVMITAGPNQGQREYIEPRPFMGPAYDKNEPKLEDLWRDAVR